MLREYIYGDAERVSIEDFHIGWISPIGDLFNIEYGCHNDMAEHVVSKVYGICWAQQWTDHLDAEDYIIARGWVKVYLDVQEGRLKCFRDGSQEKKILSILEAVGVETYPWYGCTE